MRLVRTLPDGRVREHVGLRDKRHAASAACNVLADNLNLCRADVVPVGVELERVPLGTSVVACGYTFRIEADS